MRFDEKMGLISNAKYFRYVDDILIFCNKSNKDAIKGIVENELLNKLKLNTNDKEREGTLTSGFEYLGYHYKKLTKYDYGFSVKEKNLIRLHNSLISTFSELKATNNYNKFLWDLNLRITGCIIGKNKYGWLFFYSQIDDIAIIHHLDWFIEKMCNVYDIKKRYKIKIKRFVKAYYEIIKKKGYSGYILNSNDISISEQIKTLTSVYGYKKEYIQEMEKEDIEALFKKELYKFAKKLDKDVQFIS